MPWRNLSWGASASSLFSAPVRGALDARSHAEASALNRLFDEKGRGLSIQAFGMLPKIREWDMLLRGDAEARRRVREVHREVSFAAMNAGVALVPNKRSDEGRALRMQLLGEHFGQGAVESLVASVPRRLAAADDVADTLAALRSAERIAAGCAGSLSSLPAVDRAGLPMAIWY